MTTRKAIAFLLIFSVIFTWGCGTKVRDGGSNKEAHLWRIGVCQSEEDPYLDQIMEGFSQALTDELSDDSVSFTREYISDEKSGEEIAAEFVRNEYDLILTIGEPALVAAGRATEEIPIITTDVIDIESAIDIKDLDWRMRTGRNITGITGMPNIPDQLSLVLEVTPEIKKLGILFSKEDEDSMVQIRLLREYLADAGIEAMIYQFSDVDKKRIKRICDRCDALFIPADSKLLESSALISKIAAKKGIPTIGGDVKIGENTLVCLCPDYYGIGYTAGTQASDILGRGKDPSKISIELNTSEGIKLYNKKLAKKSDITFPKSFQVYGQ